MGTILNPKRKLVKVLTNGPIPELGNIAGPIMYPCRINMRSIVNMVQNGKKVVEINPNNYDETVELNIQNVNKDNFPAPDKYVMPTIPVETKKEPEVKKEDVVEATQENIAPEKTVEKTVVEQAVEAASTAVETGNNKAAHDNYKNQKGHKNDFNKMK